MIEVAEPRTRHWTREEYYQMAEMGLFVGQRVELIGGEIVVMSPQKHVHYSSLDAVAEILRAAFGESFWVRTQVELALLPDSDPEPDVSVVAGSRADYADHPTTAVLVVEVSLTSLKYDRGKKASLYASVGIQDYWIVNLGDRQLEVYRSPIADASQPFGFRYSSRADFQAPAEVAPLAAPAGRIAVAALLPR